MGISCCAMLILCLNHIGQLSILLAIVHFYFSIRFYIFVTLTVIFLFLGASIVVNNLKSTADLVL